MVCRLEHANICVRDIEPMIRFLKTAFPEFQVRGEGTSRDGTRWVHSGRLTSAHHLRNRVRRARDLLPPVVSCMRPLAGAPDRLPDARNKTLRPCRVRGVFVAKLLDHHPLLRTKTKR